MRILHVLPYFSPVMGGVARVVYSLARHLARRGHLVTVLAGDYPTANAAFPEDGFHRVLLPCPVAKGGFYWTPAATQWAAKAIGDYDLIHLHEVRTFQNLVLGRTAQRLGIPYVLSAHGTLPVAARRRVAKRVWDILFTRRLVRGAARLLAVSSREAGQYMRAAIPREKVMQLPNGIDLEEFAALPPVGTYRRQAGIPSNARVVLYLGRLDRTKGLDTLIEAFSLVKAERAEAVLLIAGPDFGEKTHLRRLARSLGLDSRVRFVGPLFHDQKLAALADADVLAAPSAYEIFGVVPFEALMCGTPVVVSDRCGSAELLGSAGAGSVVPFADRVALADALLQTMEDDTRAALMVSRGQELIRAKLDWRGLLPAIEGLYAEVIGTSQRTGATEREAPRPPAAFPRSSAGSSTQEPGACENSLTQGGWGRLAGFRERVSRRLGAPLDGPLRAATQRSRHGGSRGV